jgi:branched-chain amino acid transport system ATP-binding protein
MERPSVSKKGWGATVLLEIEALRGGYRTVEVLRGISMQVAAGEIVAVLGSNGAGKSTLNNTICGLLPAFGGRIRFEGQDITRARHTDIVAAGLVQVPEGRRVFPNLSVLENLRLGSYRRGRLRREQNLERVFSLFPRLRERTGQNAGTLSGGEQQMLAIGRGLMGEPRLLILDEPSLGLSPLRVEEMFALIRGLNAEGLSILLVEQNVGQSLEIAGRAYVIENGAVVFQGVPDALLANPRLKRAYLGI